MGFSTASALMLRLLLLFPVTHLLAAAIPRAASGSDPLLANTTGGPYSLPKNSPNTQLRAEGIKVVQGNFLYGPAVAGGPYYPTGVLGLAKDTYDQAQLQLELTPETANTATDTTLATVGILQVHFLCDLCSPSRETR